MKNGLLIHQKIILIQLISILIVTMLFGVYLYITNLTKERKELNSQVIRLKTRLASSISIPMWNLDDASCDKLLSEEIQDKYVNAIAINKENGTMYLCKIKTEKGIQKIDDISKYEDNLKNSYSIIREPINYEQDGAKNKIGEIIIYTTDTYISKLLFKIVLQTVIQALLLFIILSITIYVIMRYFLSKPLQSFKSIFERGAKGDLDARYPVVENSRDEINELGIFFNKFMDELFIVIKEVFITSKKTNVSLENFSNAIITLNDHSQNEASSMEEITATMEEISAGIDNITTNSQFQYNKLNDVIVLLDELSNNINTTSITIADTQKLSQNITEQAKAGNKYLDLMNNSMTEITNSSNQVSNIVVIIDDISNQINLLSLNAAIEAARAGNAGRGFAVVADEISKLAEQTASSINDIETLIKKNNDEIISGMHNADNTFSSITEIIKSVNSIGDMMTKIIIDVERQQATSKSVNENANDLKSKSNEVRCATEEQRIAAGEILKSITNINEAIQASAMDTEQMNKSMATIAVLALELKDKVNFFKMPTTLA
jgi:methyl-accepting chemotaxis protein